MVTLRYFVFKTTPYITTSSAPQIAFRMKAQHIRYIAKTPEIQYTIM